MLSLAVGFCVVACAGEHAAAADARGLVVGAAMIAVSRTCYP